MSTIVLEWECKLTLLNQNAQMICIKFEIPTGAMFFRKADLLILHAWLSTGAVKVSLTRTWAYTWDRGSMLAGCFKRKSERTFRT